MQYGFWKVSIDCFWKSTVGHTRYKCSGLWHWLSSWCKLIGLHMHILFRFSHLFLPSFCFTPFIPLSLLPPFLYIVSLARPPWGLASKTTHPPIFLLVCWLMDYAGNAWLINLQGLDISWESLIVGVRSFWFVWWWLSMIILLTTEGTNFCWEPRTWSKDCMEVYHYSAAYNKSSLPGMKKMNCWGKVSKHLRVWVLLISQPIVGCKCMLEEQVWCHT